MKLLIILLVVVVVSVEAQQRKRYCRQEQDCREDEVCEREQFNNQFWMWFRLGVCKPSKPQVKTCTSGSQCGDNECCVIPSLLKGRKKRQAGEVKGTCKPLQKLGASCLVQYPSSTPVTFLIQCPCTADLKCISDSGRLVPQGFETGVCGVPEPEPKKCRSGSDCGPGECCESTAPVRGRKKRQAGGQGVCKPLQTSEGQCLMKYSSGKPADTVFMCPCVSGLTCQSDGGRLNPQGETGICGAPVACNNGSDCGPEECCKSRVRPIGRRRRQSLSAGGVCEPLGGLGDDCFTRYSSGKPDAMAFSCPCKLGLTCKGSGTFDIPLGETGSCDKA